MSVLRSRMLTAQLGLPKTVFVCKSERRVSIDFNESNTEGIDFVKLKYFSNYKIYVEKKGYNSVCVSMSMSVFTIFWVPPTLILCACVWLG